MYHGLKFDPSGQCVQIPGQDNIPAKLGVRSFPVVEKDHLIWIWMGDADKADPAQIVDYQSDRIARTVEQLLHLARRRPAAMSDVSVVNAVSGIVELMRPEARRRRIGIRFETGPAIPEVRGNVDPIQQVDFLDRLRRGVLPVSRRSQDLVRDILPVTRAGDAVIRAKSGLLGAERVQPSLGWMVGWAEKGEARAVFALNMDCKEPRHIADRMNLTQACLKDIGAI